MLIKEVIANWLADSAIIELADSAIIEMAMARSDAESKITDRSEPITEHLIKVLKWSDSLNYDKHCRDIDHWIFSIQRIKLKNGSYPTQKDLFQWMFKDVASDIKTVEQWIQGLHRYHHLQERYSDIEVFDHIKSIIYAVADDLSKKQFKDIKNYLP